MAFQNFENLEVWKRSMDLCEAVYREVSELRPYGLRDQLERSALSVPSNIAEGQERDAPRDFIRFLRISKGSCGEMRTQLILASRLGVISAEKVSTFINESREISAMLQGLVRSIQKRFDTP